MFPCEKKTPPYSPRKGTYPVDRLPVLELHSNGVRVSVGRQNR